MKGEVADVFYLRHPIPKCKARTGRRWFDLAAEAAFKWCSRRTDQPISGGARRLQRPIS